VDPVAQKEMSQYKMNGVPSFVYGEEVIVGFNAQKLLALIDFKVFTCKKCDAKMRVPKDKGTIILKCSGCDTKYKIKT